MAPARLGSPLGRLTLLLLSGGLLASAVSDSGFSYLALQEAHASGMRIDVGWFLGYLLVFLAARQAPRHAAAWMEPPLTSQSATVVPYAAVGLAFATMIGALLRGRGDPFVFWVGVFLVVALVARKVLVAMEQTALQKSFEAWMPPQWEVLEDWIPRPGATFAPATGEPVGYARRRWPTTPRLSPATRSSSSPPGCSTSPGAGRRRCSWNASMPGCRST